MDANESKLDAILSGIEGLRREVAAAQKFCDRGPGGIRYLARAAGAAGTAARGGGAGIAALSRAAGAGAAMTMQQHADLYAAQQSGYLAALGAAV